MSDNIKVVVKVRPLISRELEDKQQHQWRIHCNTLYQLDSNGRDTGQAFTFDKVYSEDTKTSGVYNDVAKPIVEAATAGFNGTIFAYGQTSSGKTYTMTGTDTSPGIIPLAVLNLFEIIKSIPDRDFLVRVSYIEIYNETLKDLLDVKRENIRIHETYEGCIKVDATEKVTSSPEEVLEAMREGEVNRQTGATNMNEKSSRSHSIFQITIESREHIEGTQEAGCVNVSQLNLVDLAGSERAGQTGATGLRFKEGTHINKSLSALALVIKQLSEDPNKYVNYRDSKLTRILQNSLGGNAKTGIICAITPAVLEETISTLQFATRAKKIKNKPEVNAVATDATMIQDLTKQLSRLQSQLESKKNLEVMLKNKQNVEQDLQNKIANLQKLILNGFGRRSSIEEMGGARRKQAPRRITISTTNLHPINEDIVPVVPKFCTPSLKYNPMLIQNPGVSEFVPVQSSTRLASLPEEPRLVTPPPNEKKRNSSEDDVIEIDSDDDNSTIPTCSPYHKCFSVPETPPCILRKKCHQAEKNYKEILEFTEREKMFKPDVVELMEKLESSTNITLKLQEEIEMFRKNSKEKDLEMEHLLFKVRKAEDELKNAKMELETRSMDYNTRLTDCEVSYEILKNKAKLREKELLSLLEEQKQRKCEDISKLPAKPVEKDRISFMDLSKDISLVNSDNESSIITSNEGDSSDMKSLVSCLQDQLIAKGQTISQLEANIESQKRSIEYLEESSHELQKLIDSFKEKNICLENENSLYKSNVNILNDTINNQKEALKKAQDDISSYNHIVQDLHMKLTKKDNLLNMTISDSVLENMIANEEKIIANNDNINNIIHSFKIALESRNKEIEQLKSSMNKSEISQNNMLNDDITDKIKQINVLNEEITKLKDDANSNIITINNLMREKTNLSLVEEELTKKIAELENRNMELSELNKENVLRIDNLNETNQTLLQSLSDKNVKEQEYVQLNNALRNKLDEMSQTLAQIQEEINTKNDIISSLNEVNNEKQTYEDHAKSALDILTNVLSILSGDIQEIPDVIDNFVSLFNALNHSLCLLESVAIDTVSEKNIVYSENLRLKSEIVNLADKFDVEKKSLQFEIHNLKETIEDYLKENLNLKATNKKISDENQREMSLKNDERDTLLEQFNSFKDNASKLSQKLLQKQQEIVSFKEKETALRLKIDSLEAELQDSKNALKAEQHQSKLEAEKFFETQETMKELKKELQNKYETQAEVTLLQEKASEVNLIPVQDQIENIWIKLCDTASKLNIDNSITLEYDNHYDKTLVLLDKMKNEHLIDESNIKLELVESKKSIETLLGANQNLSDQSIKLQNENKSLCDELEKNTLNMDFLAKSLTESNKLLEQLKEDLEDKVLQIQVLESNAQDFKDQFINLNISMNQRMQDLRQENEMLKVRCGKEQVQCDNFSEETHNFNLKETKSIACENVKRTTPPSLLTICCNTIVDAIEPKHNDSNLSTPSSSDTAVQSTAKCATCDHLALELRILEHEKCSLLGVLEASERANKELLLEQENIRKEVQSLIEPAQELQKKISSHKTNLSILTATTYAENRSLNSQVLALKHYHGKLLNICQGDIPEFRKQLRDLFVMLKSDDKLNTNLKRYSLPDVLDNNTTELRNDSTLDGDLLMLDTNVTLTTTGDNTLVGYDQTCLDLTQTMLNEASCQTNESRTTEINIIPSNMSLLGNDNQNMFLSLELLKEENHKLKALVDKYSGDKVSETKVDRQCSPIKMTTSDAESMCSKCRFESKPPTCIVDDEVKCLQNELKYIDTEKQNIERKYNDLLLEMPKTDILLNKLKSLEQENNHKSVELNKLTSRLNNINKELKLLREENDTLSTQLMENISEGDNLNEELNKIKSENLELIDKVRKIESTIPVSSFKCLRCESTEITATRSVPNKDSPHSKLNRSLSDSETSSRFNKICTLQSELCAGREDCKDLTEHVATIKHHLNCSNVSMELDDSVGDSNISQPRNFVTLNSQQAVYGMPHIQEEQPLDIYSVDKMDCYNYYLEITGEEKRNISIGMKVIDIFKMFYNNLLEKHGNEVENLANKLKDYEELHRSLQSQTDEMASKYSAMLKTLEDKEEKLNMVSKFRSQLKCNINRINNELNKNNNEDLRKVINIFKQNFLNTLDYEFGISSAGVFDVIMLKCQEEVNTSIEEFQSKIAEKEGEYNLLKAHKEKMVEISGAVTLDIVRKEQLINKSLSDGCQKLLQHKLITSDLALSESASDNVDKIIDHVINKCKPENSEQYEKEIQALTFQIQMSNNIIDEKEKEVNELKAQVQSLRDENNNVMTELTDKEVKIQTLKASHDELTKAYNSKIQENINKLNEIDKLSEEISVLKETIVTKESLISSLSDKNVKTTELLDLVTELKVDNGKMTEEISHLKEMLINKESSILSLSEKHAKATELIGLMAELKEGNVKLSEEISNLRETIKNKESLISSLSEKNAKTTELHLSIKELQENNNKLKYVNQMIIKEKESYSEDLKKSSETIKENIAEIEKMTSDILILRESVKDATSIIESLKEEVQKLTVVNTELKLSLEEKRRECARLEMNIKTHDKTAELQSKMIMRLNKQKQEDDRVISEKLSVINEVNEKYNTLQDECEKLKNAKESLEARVSELQEAAERPRASLEADSSRRRRQSIHDSKRMLENLDEQRNLEALFESRQKSDDLFSEGDDTSGRSTPFGLARGHDSLHSRTEQSDKDEDHSSRPSSVQAARRRRQSIHDLHRGVTRHTPSPLDFSGRIDESHSRDSSGSKGDSSVLSRLRTQLTSCQQELEELKERYKELDEECETCAEYLRERDEQCARLRKEKTALEKQVTELKSGGLKKPNVTHVAVNTDKDWANLHSVVVDRMSFDAEVDKNKRLSKIIEELRFQKQDLKNTVAKMQKALEKQHASNYHKELEVSKKELKSVKAELEELRVKYKELDEECETCAQYLKEREEQCRHLKEAKAALESKLQELQEESQVLAHYSLRRKRQSAHDQRRDTGGDSLSSLVVHDDSSLQETDDKQREIKRLKLIVEKLSHQKASLEQQLKGAQAQPAPHPVYVATGSAIVQNQQLTDVMKENQRLKKMNAKLVNICKKRGKSEANRENEDPCEL